MLIRIGFSIISPGTWLRGPSTRHRWKLALAMVLALGLGFRTHAQSANCPQLTVPTEAPRDKPSTPRIAQIARSLPLGTSALVVGDSTAGRWPHDEMNALIGATAIYLTMGGDKLENTNWIVDQINRETGGRVATVISSVGSGNLFVDDECSFDAKAKALMARLRNRFPIARIYAIGLYQKGPFGQGRLAQVTAFNNALRRAADANHITFVDVFTPLARQCVGQENCIMFEPNRVHPSTEGYVVMSSALQKAMGK